MSGEAASQTPRSASGLDRGETPSVPIVRAARIEDLQQIVDLLADDELGAAREGGDLAPYAAGFARITADPNQIQVVADLSGQVVGILQLTFIPSLSRRGATRAQIGGVRTLSTMRGRGIGEVLLDWALEETRRRGVVIVQLTSDSTRVNAHRFYERFGFVGSHVGMRLDLRRR